MISRIASCHCGQVELAAAGEPIAAAECCCDDCQAGARQIEALPGAHAVRNPEGGVAYVLYRKDRIRCTKGAAHLRPLKLREKSATNRVVAGCCNSAMFVNFDDARYWVCAYRGRFRGEPPAIQMRICTKFMSPNAAPPSDIPSYRGYPLRFMLKLLAAWVPMLLRR